MYLRWIKIFKSNFKDYCGEATKNSVWVWLPEYSLQLPRERVQWETAVAQSVVSLYVCLLVTLVSPAKTYDWTDRDAVWRADLGGLSEPCVRWGRDPRPEGALLWVFGAARPIRNHWESTLRCFTQQKNQYWQHRDCGSWLQWFTLIDVTLHCPAVPPVMRAFVKTFLTTVIIVEWICIMQHFAKCFWT